MKKLVLVAVLASLTIAAVNFISTVKFDFLTFSKASAQTGGSIYYISPNGNDNNSGISESAPWATFSRAWQTLQPGDTLYLLDGTYYQSLAPTINGTANSSITDPVGGLDPNHPLDDPQRTINYIKVRALHDGQAIIDGQHQRIPVNLGGSGVYGRGNYFWIEGVVAKNSSDSVFHINSRNVVIKRATGLNANPNKNVHVFNVYTGGNLTNPSNILIEDSVASGTGRKMFMAYASYVNVVFRRVVSLHQSAWRGGEGYNPNDQPYCAPHWQQTDGIEIYNWDQPDTPNNSLIENSISLGGGASYGFNLTPNPATSIGNSFLGDISVNNGMNYDGTFKAWNGQDVPEVCRFTRFPDFISWDGVRTGFAVGAYGTPTMRNNRWQDIFASGNASVGLFAGGTWGAESTNNTITRATIVNNSVGVPLTRLGSGVNASNLQQFTSVTDSRIPGTTYDGGSGASFIYRYVNGILMDGSNGQNPQYLWPIPMQDRILKELGYDVTGEITEILRANGTPVGSDIPIPSISPLPARPVTNLNPGRFDVEYQTSVTISMSTQTSGGEIRYTLDGTEPTASSTLYTSPVTLNSTTMVKAKVFVGSSGSYSRSAYYRIGTTPNAAPQVVASILPERSNSLSGKYYEMVLPRNMAHLYGQVEDFTFPQPTSSLGVTWSQVSGPETATFADPNKPRTHATFPTAGLYVLRLTATDGALSGSDEVTVRVWPNDLVGVVFTLPGKLEAENYRSGGEGVGYHQTHAYGDPYYRSGSRIDVIRADKEGGFSVFDIYPGDWLAYEVNLAADGVYQIRVRLAVAVGGGTFHLELDDQPITETITIPTDSTIAIGNYNYHTDVNTSTTVPLSAGPHVLKLVADNPSTAGTQLNVAINYLEFTRTKADITGDDLVNAEDVLLLFQNWFIPSTLSADIYQDNRVNGIDFSYLKRDWKP
jgi:hypothetical protein